jgi:hypothetical protein
LERHHEHLEGLRPFCPQRDRAGALLVAGGGTWQLFDDIGALSPCTTSGRLNVNEDRWATLYICENSSNETCLYHTTVGL